MADRAQENRILAPQQVERVLGHHSAVPKIVVAAPIEMLVVQARIVLNDGRVEHANRLGSHLFPHAIPGDHSDRKSFHVSILFSLTFSCLYSQTRPLS